MPKILQMCSTLFILFLVYITEDDVVVAVLAERTVRFSKVPSCEGSNPAIDTELWLRKTSYTCALSKIASSRALKTELTQLGGVRH